MRSSRDHEPGCSSSFGKLSTEFGEIRVAGRLAGELHLEDSLQQSAKLPQSRQFNVGCPAAEVRDVGASQETGRFTEANCIREFTEVVA